MGLTIAQQRLHGPSWLVKNFTLPQNKYRQTPPLAGPREWSEWGEWSVCAEGNCRDYTRTRCRHCQTGVCGSVEDCPGPAVETQPCSDQPYKLFNL